LTACIDSPACDTFVTWGITDRLPPEPDSTGGSFGGALWIDAADNPKPAFDAMATALGPAEQTTAATAVEPTSTVTTPATSDPEATEAEQDDNAAIGLIVGVGALALIAAIVLVLRRRSGNSSS
jgi:hypothetical protein